MSDLSHQRAERVLEAAKDLMEARLRPNSGWHNHWKHQSENSFYRALNDYAAALAAGADPQVWQDSVNEAKQLMRDRAKPK